MRSNKKISVFRVMGLKILSKVSKSAKVEFWPLPPPPKSTKGVESGGGGADSGLLTIIQLDRFHIYCTYVCMRNFSKKYGQLAEFLQN